MKATGIVRRIDDLGRVVIPREIRRTMRLHYGDPLEIFVEDDVVIFRKYDIGARAREILGDLVEAIEEHPYRQQIIGILADVRKLLETDKAPDATGQTGGE